MQEPNRTSLVQEKYFHPKSTNTVRFNLLKAVHPDQKV